MRILLADGEFNVRYGLRVLLEERSELEVVGQLRAAIASAGHYQRKGD